MHCSIILISQKMNGVREGRVGRGVRGGGMGVEGMWGLGL